MTTFNAGAIEANLTLGRSSWTKDLRKTQVEIRKLEQTSITIGLDLDTDNFRVQLDNAERMAADFDGNEYAPTVDLVTREFDEKMAELEARLDRLDTRDITVDVDVEADIANAERTLREFGDGEYSPTIDLVTLEFDAKLAEIEARLDLLDAREVVVSADADIDNAIVQLGLVEQEMDLLESDPVMITADADIGRALAGLSILEDQMDAIEADPITIRVHQRGIGPTTAKLIALQAQLEVMDSKSIDVDVNYDQDTFEQLVGSSTGGGGGHMGLLRILIYAIIALSPILGVAIAAMSASIVGFTAALVAALGPLAVLGVGIAGLVQRFKDAKKEGDELSGPMQALDDALTSLSDAWNFFLDQIEDEGFQLMADAVQLLADIIPTLAPLFNDTAEMLGVVLRGVRNFVESPEYDEMISFFRDFGIDMLRRFINIGGNLIVFFGRLFDAIAPFARQMMRGLDDITAGWAAWADDLENNDAFQQWVDNALEYGPRVLDMLGSLLAAFMNIGQALLPFAGPMLDALTWFFDLIANADPTVLTIIIGALAGLWAGLNIVAPLIVAVVGGVQTLIGVVGFLISPIGLVVLAIAGLVGILIYLWNTNEEFRTAVINTWNTIRDTMAPIIQDIVTLIRDNWGPIKEWVLGIWNDVQSIIVDAMVIIQQVVRGGAAAISFIWDNFGRQIIQYIRGAFTIIGGIIRGWFQFAKGIFQVIRGVLTGDWRQIWEGIKNILRGVVTALSGIVRGFWMGLRALWSSMGTAIRLIWSNIWENMKEAFTRFVNGARDKIYDLVGMFRAMPGKIREAVSGAFDSIGIQFRSAINGIISWWNGLSFSIPGIDPPGPGPKFSGFTVSTPNIPEYARGAYVVEPTMGIFGEAGPEILAPEPVLERIVREESGANIDYGQFAAAVATALYPLMMRFGISREDIERLIAEAGPKLEIDARSDNEAAGQLAKAIGFQLRLLGFGGKQVA